MYSITAIPTTYNGRRYRSRLEAKWASFFDLVGWRHEYEPMDLGKWSPDFALFPTDGGSPLLVEVKPISSPDQSVMDRIGAYGSPETRTEVLLLGLAPFPGGMGTALGWLAEYGYPDNEDAPVWAEATIIKTDCYPQVDFCHEYGSYRGRITSFYDGGGGTPRGFNINGVWNEATNRVQWRGR